MDEINKPIKSNKPGGKTETMSLAKDEQGIYIYMTTEMKVHRSKTLKCFFKCFSSIIINS